MFAEDTNEAKGMTTHVGWWGQPSEAEPLCPLHLPLELEPRTVEGLLRENSIWLQNENTSESISCIVLRVPRTFCLALKTVASRGGSST